MQNKIVQIALTVMALLAALWLVTGSLSLPIYLQIVVLVSIVVLFLVAAIARKLPIDYKFLCILILGYALAGKGFAYLSPMAPVYIGEITLVICAVGIIFRWWRRVSVFPTWLHWVVFMWMVVVGLYLLAGFQEYQMMAIRDSVIGYYAAFFFFAYAMFQNQKVTDSFPGTLKWAIIFGIISCFIQVSGIYGNYIVSVPVVNALFYPHPDAYIPLVVGGAVYGVVKGFSSYNLVLVFLGAICMMLLLMAKTAGVFSLGCVVLFLLIFAKRMELLFVSGAAVAFGAVLFAILVATDSAFFREVIMQSDQVQTLYDLGTATGEGNTSTTDWRLTWWKVIYEDTMRENPWLGIGLGGDITSNFLTYTFGPRSFADADQYARYPHCVLFTVFGRMGILGLVLFLGLFSSLFVFCVKFAKAHFCYKHIDSGALVAFAIFLSGLTNSLVQATYEVPHAAITHWVCLGYMMAFHVRSRSSLTVHSRHQPDSKKAHGILKPVV